MNLHETDLLFATTNSLAVLFLQEVVLIPSHTTVAEASARAAAEVEPEPEKSA